LPEYLKNDFIVIEEGQYFLSNYFDRRNDDLGLARFNELSEQHSAFFYIIREVDELGQTTFRAWMNLPESEEYGCVNSGFMFVVAEQVASRMNASEALRYVEKEREGLELLKQELDKAFNCCSQTANKNATYCTSCGYGAEPTLENILGFFNYEQKILSITFGGKFLKLDNLTNIVATKVNGSPDLIEVEVTAKWKSLPGGLIAESFGDVLLTHDLKALRTLGGNEVKIRSKLFDHTNCSDLQRTLADWSPMMQSGNDFSNATYAEEIIVLSLGGEIAVYSRLRSQSPFIADYCEEDNNNNLISASNGKNDKVFLPVALVVREILKRALMGAINVFIDVGLGVTVEKSFHQLSDECEVNTWGAAWNRYNETLSGWTLFFTFVDGAIDNAALSVITAGLTEATTYLLNPASGASFNKGSPEFNIGKFFDHFVRGCIKHVVTGQVLDIGKHATKAVKKLRGENLTPTQLNQLTGEVIRLARFFIEKKGRGVRAWEVVFPDAILRRDPSKLGKVTAYQSDFSRSFDDITAEFNSLPPGERGFWIDHLEFRTSGNRVNKAADRPDAFNAFASNDAVPNRYTSDNRFNDLASDPDHGGQIKVSSRREATAGLEAETQGLVPGPISRDPSGAEFIDGNGGYWDVKTPPGQYFNVNSVGNSIKDEVTLTVHKVILDTTYISDVQLNQLRTWLQNNLGSSDLQKIVEVNVNLR
jgi:hypothetical protein